MGQGEGGEAHFICFCSLISKTFQSVLIIVIFLIHSQEPFGAHKPNQNGTVTLGIPLLFSIQPSSFPENWIWLLA